MKKHLPVVLSLLLLAMVFPSAAVAEQMEQIVLEASLIKGRDPNQNVVQDYGDILWTELLIQEFEKRHPHIKVEIVPGDIAQVTVAIAGGIGPDLVNGAGSTFNAVGAQGGFLDLTPFLENDDASFLQNYWPPQMEAFQHEGRLFALPDYLGTVAMFYNVDIFDNFGIAPPSPHLSDNTMDWDGFEDMLKKLTRDMTGDGVPDVYGLQKSVGNDRMGFWMLAGGAEYYVDGDRNKSALDSNEAIAALEYLARLRWESGVMRPGGVPQTWLNGGVAIEEGGSWLLTRRLGADGTGALKVPFRWNVFPVPMNPSGNRATLATTDGWAINKNTKHPEAAYELLKFLTGPEANEIRAKYVALQPAHREVIPEYINLMRALNREASEVDVHVFTDAAPYAYPQMFYSDQAMADSLMRAATIAIFDNMEPVRSTWLDTIRRLNSHLATQQ